MDQPPKKRGWPRLIVTKEVVERRRLAKQKSNALRRNLHEITSSGSSNPTEDTSEGTTVAKRAREQVQQVPQQDYPAATSNGNEGVLSVTVDEGASGAHTELRQKRRCINRKKVDFVNNNVILNLGGPEGTCGFCQAQVWPAEFTGRHVDHGPKGYSICCGKGKVQLILLHETPLELAELLTELKNIKLTSVLEPLKQFSLA